MHIFLGLLLVAVVVAAIIACLKGISVLIIRRIDSTPPPQQARGKSVTGTYLKPVR